MKNSIANGLTGPWWTGFAPDLDYNVKNPNGAITGSRSKNNVVVTFVDAAGGGYPALAHGYVLTGRGTGPAELSLDQRRPGHRGRISR